MTPSLLDHVIDGWSVPAASGGRFAKTNPANGETLWQVAEGGRADLDATVEGIARAAFLDSGQVCLGTERVYIERPVFERFVDHAERLARAIRVGMFWINAWRLRDLRTPSGGAGLSGIGHEGGEHSLDFYSDIRTVCLKGLPAGGTA